MDEVCYDKTVEFLKGGHQVMIFVHARNATVNTAMVMKEMAQQNRETALFLPEDNNQYGPAKSAIEKSRNRQLKFQEQGLMYYFVLLDATVSVLVTTSLLA